MSKFASLTEVYVSNNVSRSRQVLIPTGKVTRVEELDSGHPMYGYGARTMITTGKDACWYIREEFHQTHEGLEA